MPDTDPRQIALRTLVDYERRDAYLNLLLSGSLENSGLQPRDRALVTELVLGTVRMRDAVDWVVSQFSSREISSMEPSVRWALRMSAYQVLFTGVPDYAACDTAVRLVREERGAGAASFTNGVLRALARGRSDVGWPDRDAEPVAYLSVRHSHPRWLVEMWVGEMGLVRAERLLEADNRRRPASIRCNTRKASRDALADTLRGRGFDVSGSELAPEGLLVSGGGSPTMTPEYSGGLYSIQDQGAMTVSRILDPPRGSRVLDLCAAPGGKANHLAEMMSGTGTVLAVDVNPARMKLVEDAAMRLGNESVRTLVADARQFATSENGSATNATGCAKGSDPSAKMFERVLLDAPCSGLGTLGRKPDLKWRRKPEQIEGLVELQKELLEAAASAVAPGGRLAYSTCTISARENEGVARWFAEKHDEFSMLEPRGVPRGAVADGFVTLTPDENCCDGTFIALFERTG